MAKAIISAARLRELLDYDPETGIFRWRVDRGSVRAGKIAGTPNGRGYLLIRVDGRLRRANRLAWLYVTGEHPSGEVDHENGVKHDNWFGNLRDVPLKVNRQNIRKAHITNASGVLGVSELRGRHKAQLWVDGVNLHLGFFDTEAEAHSAYLEAKRRLHEGCTI